MIPVEAEHTILVVDDDPQVLGSTQRFLERNGYCVCAVQSGRDAIEKVTEDPTLYSLVILDYDMPEMNGGETARRLVEVNKDLFILIFSAVTHITLKANQIEFVEKGIPTPQLLQIVEAWCRKFDETNRVVRRPVSLDENEKQVTSAGLVGRPPQLAELVGKVMRWQENNSDAPVLILGESGTGKERFAKLIHEKSLRKGGPFVAVNMGALSEGTVESELFGHVKGAFTGAVQDRDGKFKAAEGGTLFLDEIGDASLKVQVGLLRVIQEKILSPIGSNKEIRTNVRIIAATNKDIQKAIEEGKFREDLYYRIRGAMLELPPLRERPQDIEPVIIATTEKFNLAQKTKKGFLTRTVRAMERLYWKGNIRELENVVEEYLTECPENKISPEVLDLKLYRESPTLKDAFYQLRARHDQEEREFFQRMISTCRSQRDAAKQLDIPPSTVISTLERLQLPTDFRRNFQPLKAVGNGIEE